MPEPVKSFNNVILGQYVLTGVPIKVYVDGRFLTITSIDDVEDPIIGFGMDENGQMIQFSYIEVEKLLISGNEITIDTYNQGMGAKEDTPEKEEPAEEEPKKEESIMKLKSLVEITKAEFDAQMKSIDVSKKALIDKERDLKQQPIEDGVVNEDHYTFGTGDIVKNKNKSCPHYGSMGIVDKMMDLPDYVGKVAVYTVTNTGDTYKPGDRLTKTVDQLEPVDLGTVKMDDEDLDELNVRKVHGDKKVENPKTGKKIKFSSALKAPKGTAVYNKARKMYKRYKED